MINTADAYSAGAEAWGSGPIRQYGTMAELLLACAPFPLSSRRVLDLGAGTGAASRPAMAAGASVIALDNAFGMLCAGRAERPPGVVGDAVDLPLQSRSFDAVVAAFSLNHLDEPAAGVCEAARILRRDGVLLASTYAIDDDHPVKAAVERALGDQGWQKPDWYPAMKRAMAAWGTIETATSVVERGGMYAASVERRDISFPELDADALVNWRLGMAQAADFMAALEDQERRAVADRARELLGPDPEPLVRRAIFIVARAR